MEPLTPSPSVADMNLRITRIECHPKCLVIMFQGQQKPGCELDYYILQHELQRVFKEKGNVCVGESCLVEDSEGMWHRGRVLEKRENVCEAFLIDSGRVLVVEETHIASACDELFQLPPKVVLGVFANILPLGEKWAPKAINYFSSLVGLQITGHVKAVISYKLFVLEVPKIISDALELQLGKLVDDHSFCFIVQILRAFPQEMLCERVPQLLQQKYPVKNFLTFSNSEKPTDVWPVPSHLFPCLPVGSKESVKITVVISPNKFYCQIQKWQKELEDLTRAMHLYYEGISTENNNSSDSLGLLCAAKRQDGQWHRGVIKQHLFDYVEVWFMDFGNTEAVPPSCLQNLKAEFMALPMMSFPCALSCFDNGDETTMKIQLKELSQALIEETSVCICVDSFNDIKQFYYITLQHQQNEMNAKLSENVNEAAASPALLSETEITSIAVNDKLSHERYNSFKNCTGNKHTENCLPELDIPSRHGRRLEMEINSCHTAFVVYIINPSCFWIQVCDYQSEFQVLMRKIEDTYSQCGADEMVLKNPEPGLLCCARYSKDRLYYRGVVVEVLHANITVYFLDFGSEDTLPKYDVKVLLPEFSDLPALAICCALAFTTPVDDVWVKKEIDFFKEIVLNKILLFEVIGKQSNKHIVKALFMNGLQQKNVAICMVQAGYAEYLEMVPDSVPKWKKKGWKSPHNKKEKVNPQTISNVCKNEVSRNAKVFQKQEPLSLPSILRESVVLSHFGKDAISKRHKLVPREQLYYKELVFKPGAGFEVVCSCIVSPENFSCQLQSRVPELNNLMEKIQTYYKNHTSPYKTGQVACIVNYPKDEKWYRATVVQQVSTNEVDVVFVDYGYQERILLKDLQAVVPDFLILESQAFRCRLKDAPLQTNWSEEVLKHFKDFISSSGGPLTCIIYAAVLVSPNCLHYIVDLQTPSTTAEEFLREHGLAQSEYMELRNLAPLGSLYSFCYSSFNIKIGNEEEVYITHIHSPSKFYCQLNRNSETLEALMRKVSIIANLANNTKYNHSNARLCIARNLEDGLFYRALTFPVESASCLRADFVDFGNKSIVERDELMPIPDSATDLIFTPMQAIKCCLSDFKETQVPAGVTRWFEETFHGKLVKAVIVSRASNGKIVVELYDGQLKVSQKIKEKILEELAQKNCTEQFLGNYKGVIGHIEDDRKINKVTVKINERVKLKNQVKCQAYDTYYQPDTGQNFGDEVQTAHSALKLLRGSSKPQTFQSRKNAFSVGLKHRKKPLVGELASLTLCHPALNSKQVSVNALSESQGRQNHTGQQEISNENIPKLICQLICLPQHDFQVNSEVVGGMDVICGGKPMSASLLSKKGRTKWQNPPRHNQEKGPKQIKVTNGRPQDRKSRNGLCGLRKTPSKRPLNILPQKINSGWVEGAKVTNISENGEFHVQLCRNLQILHNLNVMLIREAQVSDLLRVDDIEEGLECMTKSETNLAWYRSKVIKKFVKEKLMLVVFMDYGNSEMVSLNNAKMLSDKMKSIPKQAVLCKWAGFKRLKKVQIVHVVNALLDNEINVLFLRYLECSHIWEVDILMGEIPLQEHLKKLLSYCQATVGPEISSNADCKELDTSFRLQSIMWILLHRGRSYPGFATAVTDPSNFCIRFEVLFNCMTNLAFLLSDLPDNLPALPEELVAPGARCLIKFELEKQWNRAEISEVTSQSVVLMLIDYGFQTSIPYSDIHKLKVIPESLSYLPHLAHSCSLHGVVPAKGECWSSEAKLLFRKLLNEPGLVFHFKHYGSGMKLEVDVLHKEYNLAHALISAGHAVKSRISCCLIPVDRIK